MFEQEIDELYDLAKRVLNETNSHVVMNIAREATTVFIQDGEMDPGRPYDGVYPIYSNRPLMEERSREEYESAKAHLLRLLED